MIKRLALSVSMIAAFAVVTLSADAAEQVKRKRKGFFESLFGSYEGSSRERRLRQPKSDRAWWEDGDDVRIIYGDGNKPKKKKNTTTATAFVDPEIGEGLGMGNRVYALPKLFTVADPAFSKLTTIETDNSAIRLALADKAMPVQALEATRKLVLEHYKSAGFAPIWTKNGQLGERGVVLLKYLAKAADEGLEPQRYLPAVLKSFDNPQSQIDGDSFAAAQLDVGLTVAALNYAQHISGGAYEPLKLSGYHDMTPEAVDGKTALRVLAWSPFPDVYLQGLAPTHPAYAAFKSELALSVSVRPENPEMPSGKRIRVGQKDSRIVLLRERLVKDGFIPLIDAEVADDKRDVLDKVLAKALKAFQQAKAVPQTSNLDDLTTKALNGLDNGATRERLISNMERLRWLPKSLGNRHVFVNQASFKVAVMEAGKPVWTSNVIVGRPFTQTAVFSDSMETVVFNPSWGVPQSIILNEYLPKLRRNPGYLDKIGFKVVNANGKVVSSRSVNWSAVGSRTAIGIQQPPGASNALGEIKFLFPNKHSIYMHDTPNRHLFAESSRAFSHGCVRVENPREFAQVLLGWDAAKIADGIESGASKNITLEKPVPVHLTYFTAWPDVTGKIQYFSDIYERDSTLLQARKIVAKAFGTSENQRIVATGKIVPASVSD